MMPATGSVNTSNEYSAFLRQSGCTVISEQGIDWLEYSGFMFPAYLPHCCPQISVSAARQALKASRKAFVRWDSCFGGVSESPWWYVLRKGIWQVESIPEKKKRWMIRQGRKNFSVRLMSPDEVVAKCPAVAGIAVARYKGAFTAESQEFFEKQRSASEQVPGVLEYMGCFLPSGQLVSYAENHIQKNAVFMANIRHDPDFLGQYSGYGLVDAILEHYLNEKGVLYVMDGCRSLYHKTEFQDYLSRVFGFVREYALLNVEYSALLGCGIKVLRPVASVIESSAAKSRNATLAKVRGLMLQDDIQRDCRAIMAASQQPCGAKNITTAVS